MPTVAKLAFTGVLAAALLAAAPRDARACTCFPPDLPTVYNSSSDVFTGQVLGSLVARNTRFFVFRIGATYKGCTEAGNIVLVSSAADSAGCGVDLRVRQRYLITAAQDEETGVFEISLCGYNAPVSELTDAEWQFLETRYNCCGGECECVNDDPVLCFADPCSVESCEEGECVSNYCGGCWAEFYTESGSLVCNSCRSGDDCAFGQVCSWDGECRTECFSDEDCDDDQFCGGDGACHSCPADIAGVLASSLCGGDPTRDRR